MPKAKKATTTRTTAKTTTPVSFPESLKAIPSTRSLRLSKRYTTVALVVLVLFGLLYYFRSLFVAATVNGNPIFRLELVQQLEKQAGQQVLSTLVTQKLIEQEVKKRNITVAQDELDKEMKKIDDQLKNQGQSLDQALQSRNMSKKDLGEQIRLQLALGKLVGADVKISEKELDEYLEKNRESFPPESETSETRENVRQSLKDQKTNEKVQTLLTELQQKAKINYLVTF